MHHDHIRLTLRQPAGQFLTGDDSRGKNPTVPLVGAIVGKPTALTGQGADELGVGYSRRLEFSPEECPPTSLVGW